MASTSTHIKNSPSPQMKDISEKNCETVCNLQYGISEVFNQKVMEQQKVKASKAHIKPKIFDDPTEQANYCHMMDDVILKTFDDPSEKKIFQKALEGMGTNYPEILQGTEKNMFYCPTAFNFDSRSVEVVDVFATISNDSTMIKFKILKSNALKIR